MTDTTSVQSTQQAAATKTKELTEEFIRALLQQSKENAKDRKTPTDKTTNAPTPEASNSLFKSFYQKYRQHGVDDATAQTAAADAALGFGAKDSPAIESAEQKVLSNAQSLAEEYQVNAAIAQDKSLPIAKRRAALDRIDGIEIALDIRGKSRDEKTEILSGLLSKQLQQAAATPQVEQQSVANATKPQPAPTQTPIENQTVNNDRLATEALRQAAQEKFERAGAKPETARKASYEFATEGGAKPGPHTRRAHQEIEQHNVLKQMYQSVYEQHGVLPDIAEKAADQLARGNGANRSNDVRQAHNQALTNIGKAQQASKEPVERAIVEKDGTNRSPEDRQATRPKIVDRAQPTSPQPAAEPKQADTKIEAPKPQLSPEQIYNKYDNGRNAGVFQSVMKNNPNLRRENDLSIAKQAILDGHPLEAVREGIAQHSPHAQSLNQDSKGHESYAKRIVDKAQKALYKDADSFDAKPERRSEKAQVEAQRPGKQTRKSAQNEKQASQKQSTKKTSKRAQKRTKVKARGQGIEL